MFELFLDKMSEGRNAEAGQKEVIARYPKKLKFFDSTVVYFSRR